MIATGLLMIWLTGLSLLVVLLWRKNLNSSTKLTKHQAPGPRPWPLIGSLHLLGRFKRVPFEAFTALQKEYGRVVQLRMGSLNAVVVSEGPDVKEVLHTKGDHFENRPDWVRFEKMFGGDKNNSLAFCDMSNLQTARRRLLGPHTFPAAGSQPWQRLDSCCREEFGYLTHAIGLRAKLGQVDLKPLLNTACANIFNAYFCSVARRNYDDPILNEYCTDFDKLFWEVNNGRAMDVLPWLAPVMSSALAEVQRQTNSIRSYVLKEIVGPRQKSRAAEKEDREDMLGAWLDRVEEDAQLPECDTTIDMECALFALEDILGGHSAVSNIALRAMIDLGTRPATQAVVRRDVLEALNGSQFSLEDKSTLPRLTACFYETVRLACPPIVPHVANRDTSIAGYSVSAGSLIFVNNHHTHFSPSLWHQPESFLPERFLKGEQGGFTKPAHFQPFSSGRRSCMGYKVVESVVVSLLAAITANFEFSCPTSYLDHQAGMLALPVSPFLFSVTRTAERRAATG